MKLLRRIIDWISNKPTVIREPNVDFFDKSTVVVKEIDSEKKYKVLIFFEEFLEFSFLRLEVSKYTFDFLKRFHNHSINNHEHTLYPFFYDEFGKLKFKRHQHCICNETFDLIIWCGSFIKERSVQGELK